MELGCLEPSVFDELIRHRKQVYADAENIEPEVAKGDE